MCGGDGNDMLFGFDGNDQLVGETGNDFLSGESGNDTLDGGDGNDWLEGWSGDDVFHARAGHDTVNAGAGDDVVYGGTGNDSILGGAGNDTLDGGVGNDVLSGGDGNDHIEGDDGCDVLHGDDGNDVLKGQDDGDRLYGDLGSDVLEGGYGADTLVALDGAADLVWGGAAAYPDGARDNYWLDSADALVNLPILTARHVSAKTIHTVPAFQSYLVGSTTVHVGIGAGVGNLVDPPAEPGDVVTKVNFAGKPLFGAGGPVYSDVDQGGGATASSRPGWRPWPRPTRNTCATWSPTWATAPTPFSSTPRTAAGSTSGWTPTCGDHLRQAAVRQPRARRLALGGGHREGLRHLPDGDGRVRPDRQRPAVRGICTRSMPSA